MSDLIARLRAAAQSGDLEALHALVDWPLSGVAPMVRALADVDEADRAEVAERGLAELDAAAHEPDPVLPRLGALALRLSESELRSADETETRAALDELAAPEPPRGLSPDAAAKLELLAERARATSEVLVAERDRGSALWLAVTPEGDRVAMVDTD